MFFQQLHQLLGSHKAVNLILVANGDQIKVTVLPVAENTETSLKTPLCLEGTPAELDAGFIEAIQGYTFQRKTLDEQLAEANAAAQAEAQVEAEKLKGKKTSKKVAPATSTDNNEDAEGGEGIPHSAAAKAPAAPVTADNLFD